MKESNPMPLNPYASPQIGGGNFVPQQAGLEGLWREGNLLVMHKAAPLPPICVKSGEAATQWLKRKLVWHPPWIFALILLHVFLYAIVALILQKRATIHIGLTDEWFARRRTRMLMATGICLSGILVGVAGIAMKNREPNSDYLMLLLPAMILLLGGLIYGLIASRLVSAQRITDQYIWLKGVHPSFLDRLPSWPYGVI